MSTAKGQNNALKNSFKSEWKKNDVQGIQLRLKTPQCPPWSKSGLYFLKSHEINAEQSCLATVSRDFLKNEWMK